MYYEFLMITFATLEVKGQSLWLIFVWRVKQEICRAPHSIFLSKYHFNLCKLKVNNGCKLINSKV